MQDFIRVIIIMKKWIHGEQGKWPTPTPTTPHPTPPPPHPPAVARRGGAPPPDIKREKYYRGKQVKQEIRKIRKMGS